MKTHGTIRVLEGTITPDTNIYAAGDVVGGLVELENVQTAAGGLLVQPMSIADDDNEGAGFTIHIFDRKPTDGTDNAAWAPTFADLTKRASKVDVAAADYETINSLKIANVDDINDLVGNTQIWLMVISTGAPTYAANKTINIRVYVME